MVDKKLTAASSVPLILSILSHGESYGYQIIKNIKRLSDGKMEWADGMLYPVLQRMERDDLVQSRWEVSEKGRKRKYYSLTAKGKEQLASEKEQWLRVHAIFKELWSPNPQIAIG